MRILLYLFSYIIIGFIVDKIYLIWYPENNSVEKRIFHIIFWPAIIVFMIYNYFLNK